MKHAKSFRRLCVLGALVGGLLFVGNASFAQQKFGQKCQECHEDTVKDFNKTMHGKSWGATGKAADCNSCHGDASKHIAAGGGADSILSFSKEAKRPAEELNKQCLSCHQKNATLAMWNMGEHKKNDVACTSCHSVHKEKNIKAASTCLECHTKVKGEINKLSHHPIVEGKVSCSDCHNPHGSMAHGQIKADNLNQLCYRCHSDKRGPYVWEHPPVEEDCSKCHTPHGSVHRALLTKRPPNLCQDCHQFQNHPSTMLPGNTGFAQAGTSTSMVGQSCLNCHSRIHGSNAPGVPHNGGKAFNR